MSENKYTDTHTLYLLSGSSTKEELKVAVTNTLERVRKQLSNPLPCQFRLNVLITKEGVRVASFLYVTNPEVYCLLLGRNADGSERYVAEEVEKPTSTIEDLTNAISLGGDWADVDDSEENSPRNRVKLPSLADIILEDGTIISAIAGTVTDTPGHLASYVIRCRNLPPWATVELLHQTFCRYAGKSTTYPSILITANKGYIAFNPSLRDAQFALLMQRKFTLTGNNRKADIICDHPTKAEYGPLVNKKRNQPRRQDNRRTKNN